MRKVSAIMLYGVLLYGLTFIFVAAWSHQRVIFFPVVGAYCLYSRVTKGTEFTVSGAEISLPKNWCVFSRDKERLSLIYYSHFFSRTSFNLWMYENHFTLKEINRIIELFNKKGCVSFRDYYINKSMLVHEVVFRCESGDSATWYIPELGLALLGSSYWEEGLQADRELIARIKPGKAVKEKPIKRGSH